LKGKQFEDMRMIKCNEMHNFKDPLNTVWDNAGLEICGAGENIMEVTAQTKTKHEIEKTW